MRYILALATAITMLLATASAATSTQGKKKAPAKKTTAVRRPSATAHSSASNVRRPGTTATAGKTTAANRKKGAPVKSVTWRNRQLAPTSDRYKQIQDALSSKGYLQPEQATGSWNEASVDALKRFQIEQNLDSTGKINSLSLIALGLGPRHDALPTPAPAPEDARR
jgi:hypothetical protein